MSEKTLAELADEYEANANTLKNQIARIDEEMKTATCNHLCFLRHKRVVYEEMMWECSLTARTLRNYYT